MYDELIKALRELDMCGVCPCDRIDMCEENDKDCITIQAADAIEERCQQVDKFMEEAARLYAKQPKWIPVTERLPTGGDDSGAICENVCLLLDDGTVSCGWMNGTTKKVYYLNARDDVVIKAPITRVTHWMPLPKPPKEET